MPCNPSTPTNNHEKDQLVVNLKFFILELNDVIGANQIQEVVGLVNVWSLPQLPTRKRQGNGPLVDYSSSQVVTSYQYLVILK